MATHGRLKHTTSTTSLDLNFLMNNYLPEGADKHDDNFGMNSISFSAGSPLPQAFLQIPVSSRSPTMKVSKKTKNRMYGGRGTGVITGGPSITSDYHTATVNSTRDASYCASATVSPGTSDYCCQHSTSGVDNSLDAVDSSRTYASGDSDYGDRNRSFSNGAVNYNDVCYNTSMSFSDRESLYDSRNSSYSNHSDSFSDRNSPYTTGSDFDKKNLYVSSGTHCDVTSSAHDNSFLPDDICAQDDDTSLLGACPDHYSWKSSISFPVTSLPEHFNHTHSSQPQVTSVPSGKSAAALRALKHRQKIKNHEQAQKDKLALTKQEVAFLKQERQTALNNIRQLEDLLASGCQISVSDPPVV